MRASGGPCRWASMGPPEIILGWRFEGFDVKASQIFDLL
jgi:hypothetical protein